MKITYKESNFDQIDKNLEDELSNFVSEFCSKKIETEKILFEILNEDFNKVNINKTLITHDLVNFNKDIYEFLKEGSQNSSDRISKLHIRKLCIQAFFAYFFDVLKEKDEVYIQLKDFYLSDLRKKAKLNKQYHKYVSKQFILVKKSFETSKSKNINEINFGKKD